MIQPMYKKGNRLAWTGYCLAIASEILQWLGSATYNGASNSIFVPSLAPFIGLFIFINLVGIALLLWGSVLALKAKNRSFWWLLLFLLALVGTGVIFIAIIFMLKDKSVVAAPTSPAPSPVNDTAASPQ